jgi:hypothetical protein
MRAASHSPFATALLLIPILTVPLLAIFGVPQIMPVVPKVFEEQPSRSSQVDTEEFVPGPARNWEDLNAAPASIAADAHDIAWADLSVDSTARAVAERRAEVLRQPAVVQTAGNETELATHNVQPESAAALVSAATQNTGEVSAAREQLARSAMALGYKRPPQQLRTTTAAPTRPTRTPTSLPVESLTWQSAVRRLNDLEIRNFRLEPGQQPAQFVFICSYTPHDNPRISYRFEAEADEPLRAVEKVLAQIDSWLAGR